MSESLTTNPHPTTPIPIITQEVPMFETSPTTDLLDTALAKAQGKIKPAIKDSKNPHFNSNYADLASAWEAARGALSEAEINVTQWLLDDDRNRLKIVTRLAHKGQWMKSTWAIPVSKQDAHGYGSATTYARRFSLMAAVGIAPDDDDDENGSIDKGAKPERSPAKLQPTKTIIQKAAAGELPIYRIPFGTADIKDKTLKEAFDAFGYVRLKKYLEVIKAKDRLKRTPAENSFIIQCETFLIGKDFEKKPDPDKPSKTEPKVPVGFDPDELIPETFIQSSPERIVTESNEGAQPNGQAKNLSEPKVESPPPKMATTVQINKVVKLAAEKKLMAPFQKYIKDIGENMIQMSEDGFKKSLKWLEEQKK